ncbi:MAG: 4Fe-4S dicluster domain-containing protein [Spirochaetes bacterium]|nr:4Fe-4S dicluster domain-containing protein [Spirochaetota bacterium]
MNDILFAYGCDIFGWADLTLCMPLRFRDTPFALSIGCALDKAIVSSLCDGPTEKYLLHYRATNEKLSRIVHMVVENLQSRGARSIAIPPTVSEKELDGISQTLRYHFSHKMAATRAGLGWIGKSDLFISKKFGPRLRLATVLCERPFGEIGTPIEKNFCGSCTRCVDACPAKAANGMGWHVGVDRDEFFNAYACLDMCRKLSAQRLGEPLSICGICMAVCPIGDFF